MSHPYADDGLQSSIQYSLQEIAAQLGQNLNEGDVQQIYEEAIALLDHLPYTSITLGRVAGLLLVYQLQDVEPEEVNWFKDQVNQCPDIEDVEELIESLARVDSY